MFVMHRDTECDLTFVACSDINLTSMSATNRDFEITLMCGKEGTLKCDVCDEGLPQYSWETRTLVSTLPTFKIMGSLLTLQPIAKYF